MCHLTMSPDGVLPRQCRRYDHTTHTREGHKDRQDPQRARTPPAENRMVRGWAVLGSTRREQNSLACSSVLHSTRVLWTAATAAIHRC